MEFILPEELKEEPVEEDKLYKLIIMGAGPAGMTAAVYAARKKLETLVISGNVGGQTLLATGVETYIGYQFITGQELMRKFEEQLRQFPIPLLIGDEVAKLSVDDNFFAVHTSKGKKFRGKTVIIASGRRARSLNVPGEKDLIGRGISYCATCDAPLFDGMDVDCDCKTSVVGIFAAGDVTNAPEKQIIVAAGEGAKAALSAYRYLVVS